MSKTKWLVGILATLVITNIGTGAMLMQNFTQNNETQAELLELQNQLDESLQEISQGEAEILELQTQLNESLQEISQGVFDYRNLSILFSDLNNSYQSLYSNHTDLLEDYSNLTINYDTLDTEYQSIWTQYLTLNDSISVLLTNVTDFLLDIRSYIASRLSNLTINGYMLMLGNSDPAKIFPDMDTDGFADFFFSNESSPEDVVVEDLIDLTEINPYGYRYVIITNTDHAGYLSVVDFFENDNTNEVVGNVALTSVQLGQVFHDLKILDGLAADALTNIENADLN